MKKIRNLGDIKVSDRKHRHYNLDFMCIEHYSFASSSLEGYTFTLSEVMSYGYDQQENIWQGDELIEKCKKGLIIKEFSQKVVFFERILLGCIQECPDSTWLAHSPYTTPILDFNILGFLNEFYAIRYLHQIIKANYPAQIGDIPQLGSSNLF